MDYESMVSARREQHRAECATAVAVDRTSAEQLDRVTLVGSAAAVLASVTFLHDIADAPTHGSLTYLRTSWVLLVASGACSVSSLVAARVSARRHARVLREKIAQSDPRMQPADYDAMRAANDWTRRFNWAALGAFAGGVVALLVFANMNLPPERSAMPDHPTTQPPRVPTQPAREPQPDTGRRGYDFDVPRPQPQPQPSPQKQPSK